MTKRNNKAVRRKRHANRLSKIIANRYEQAHRFRPNDDVQLHGCEVYGVSAHGHREDVVALFHGTDYLYPKMLPMSDMQASYPLRQTRIVMAVDAMPAMLQARLRGRRGDQIYAEIAENRSRMKHGDVV